MLPLPFPCLLIHLIHSIHYTFHKQQTTNNQSTSQPQTQRTQQKTQKNPTTKAKPPSRAPRGRDDNRPLQLPPALPVHVCVVCEGLGIKD
ncbi:hypothetical protein BC567DRAFT_233743 [Phyllosticta citribraziliensis]